MRLKKEELKKVNRAYRRAVFWVFFVFFILIVLFLFLLFLLLRTSVFNINAISEHTSLIILCCVISLLIISQGVAVFWSHRITKPVAAISIAADRVSKGDFSMQIDTAGFKGEIRDLGENLNKMIRELRSIEVMQSDFVSNVSHEFRAPLSAIQGYVTLLSNPSISEAQRTEYFSMLSESTRDLTGLVESVLLLSKLESRNILPPPKELRLDEQLRRAVLLYESQWAKKELELDLELPACTYKGQPELLREIWVNLIGNAVKYTPPKGRLSVQLCVDNPAEIQVIISDTGIGMSDEVQAHIFEKFYQGDASHRSVGNGLGLSLVQTACRLTGCHIRVESTEGCGSTFTVSLPRQA